MNSSQAFTIRVNDDCYETNGAVIATHLQRDVAIAQARAIADSGYWMRVPVGFASVYEGRREIAAFHYRAA